MWQIADAFAEALCPVRDKPSSVTPRPLDQPRIVGRAADHVRIVTAPRPPPASSTLPVRPPCLSCPGALSCAAPMKASMDFGIGFQNQEVVLPDLFAGGEAGKPLSAPHNSEDRDVVCVGQFETGLAASCRCCRTLRGPSPRRRTFRLSAFSELNCFSAGWYESPSDGRDEDDCRPGRRRGRPA